MADSDQMTTQQAPDLPLPTERFDGCTVVASVWLNDEADDYRATLLLLASQPMFYRVAEIEWRHDDWHKVAFDDYPNIVPAVEAYQQQGGDY